jgi:hypoxanthine phosphoribosyltransferase
MHKKIFITQKNIDQLIKVLQNKIIKANIKFDTIIGIANGGLHISRPLAEYFSIPHISVYISCYDDDHLRDKIVIDKNQLTIKPHNCLIIDDIADTGSTLDIFHKTWGLTNNYIGVLYWNKQSKIIPDFYASIKPNNWLIFPWEQSC